MPRKHRTHWVALAVALLTVWCAGCLPLNAPATSTPSPAVTLTPSASATYTVPPATATLLPSPTPPPSPMATSAPQLEIGRLGSNADDGGSTHLAGEIHNISATPVTAIKLRLELPGHAPIDFAPQLDVIGAGQSAPFDLPLPDGVPLPDATIATIAGYSPAPAETAAVKVQAKLVDPGDGQVYLNGQLANDTGQPARMNGLAAAMLDQAGVVRAIGQAAAFVHYLAPGQRVPFAIIVPGG